MRPSKLVEQVGGSYARELGIDLSRGKSADIQKWFIAAVLFGAKISEKDRMTQDGFADFEAALVWYETMLRRKGGMKQQAHTPARCTVLESLIAQRKTG